MKDLNNIINRGFNNPNFTLSDGERDEIWGKIAYTLANSKSDVAADSKKSKVWWKNPLAYSLGAIAAAVVAGVFLLRPVDKNVTPATIGSGVVAQNTPFLPKADPMEKTTLATLDEAYERNGATTSAKNTLAGTVYSLAQEGAKTQEIRTHENLIVDEKDGENVLENRSEVEVENLINLESVEKKDSEREGVREEHRDVKKRAKREYDLLTKSNSRLAFSKMSFAASSNFSSRGNLSHANLGYIKGLVAMVGYNDMRNSSMAPQITPTSESSYSIPLSFGVSAIYHINDRVSIGSGVTYTYLHNKYSGIINSTPYKIKQGLHFIGIPVDVYYSVIKSDKWNFYVNGGGMVEKGVRATYTMTTSNGSKENANSSIKGLQYSVNAGMGVEYEVGNSVGLYAEPNGAYYFHSKIPTSIRTDQPFQFQLQVGIRIHIK